MSVLSVELGFPNGYGTVLNICLAIRVLIMDAERWETKRRETASKMIEREKKNETSHLMSYLIYCKRTAGKPCPQHSDTHKYKLVKFVIHFK